MFKKIATVYFSLMALLMLLLMILLIIVSLVDISDNRNIKIVNKINRDEVLKISTNKDVYTKAEDVLITFENLGDHQIVQDNHSTLNVKCRRDIGRNYELAFIEQKQNNDWIAIEPVKRCSDDCSIICESDKKVNFKSKVSFSWRQTILRCTDHNDASTVKANTGIYRVSSAIWNKEKSLFEKVSSNTFTISNISKN